MTLTTHAIVGAAAASFFPQHPYAAFAAGVVSHLAIDALPHWDYRLRSDQRLPGQKIEMDLRWGRDFIYDICAVSADALLGFVLTFAVAWILNIPLWLALIGAGAGLYPDLLSFAYMEARKFAPRLAWAYRPLQRFHAWVQWWELKGDNAALGISLQAALVIAVVAIAKVI